MILPLYELPVQQRQNWLQHAIAPRPIGLVSSINRNGEPNLAPFSFFNLFSCEPPIVIFSPARRVRDNSTKHTLNNMYEVREVVIHIVTYDMVQQVSLASCDYPNGVDEFIKAGFTKEKATIVQPPMVKESPVKLECRVNQIQPLGKAGGAGNLIIAEVLCMHVDESILNDEQTMIDQRKLKHVARLGGDWYCSVNESNLFKVMKPGTKPGIGIDTLPQHIRTSSVLTGNDLAMLANVHELPGDDQDMEDERLKETANIVNEDERMMKIHQYAKELLECGKVKRAWEVLMY